MKVREPSTGEALRALRDRYEVLDVSGGDVAGWRELLLATTTALVAAQSELGRLHKRAIDAGGDERCARAVAELSEYVLSLSAFRALVEGKIAEYVLS